MTIKFSLEIPKGSKVIVPSSMGSDLKGEKLKELINNLKENDCDVTILIADTLQKYNYDYTTALKMGDNFLLENKGILKDVKVIRWDEFIESKKELFEKNKNLIEQKATKGSTFYNKMVRTQNKCAVSKDIDSSLEYQKEEYAAILTMSEFDYFIYSKSITDAMACLYNGQIIGIKNPQYIHVSFPQLLAKNAQEVGIFKAKNKQQENSLPLVLRMAYDQVETVLNSNEISETSKQIFIERLNNLLILSTIEPDQKNKGPDKKPVNLFKVNLQ